MDLTSKKDIKALLKKHNIYPSKRLGQNFLIDKSVFRKILQTAELSPEDIVLEIGAGVGNLTQKLAEKAGRVITIEKDRKMIEILKESLKSFKNVQIVQGDILKMDSEQRTVNNKRLFIAHCSLFTNYKVVANLPYYITSPVIRKFLEEENQPSLMVLMIQKEVAKRICAKPPRMNLLAVSVQFYANAEIISYVSKKCFWPSPKVNSAILKITPEQKKRRINRDLFFKIVKTGFSHPRKQLVNNLLALSLPNGVKLTKAQIKTLLLRNDVAPRQRAEALTLEEWLRLVRDFQTVL